jgi:hypothetical protein
MSNNVIDRASGRPVSNQDFEAIVDPEKLLGKLSEHFYGCRHLGNCDEDERYFVAYLMPSDSGEHNLCSGCLKCKAV